MHIQMYRLFPHPALATQLKAHAPHGMALLLDIRHSGLLMKASHSAHVSNHPPSRSDTGQPYVHIRMVHKSCCSQLSPTVVITCTQQPHISHMASFQAPHYQSASNRSHLRLAAVDDDGKVMTNKIPWTCTSPAFGF